MTEQDSNKADPLANLPETLRAVIDSHAPAGDVDLTAQTDLDEQGSYADGYLVLTGDRLGWFRHTDGYWTPQWHSVKDLSSAKVVDGLGVNCLRLLSDGKVAGEYRFTLRYAREVARLHRRLEKLIEGKTGEDLADDKQPPHLEEKKLRCDKCGRVIPSWSDFCPACMVNRKILSRLFDFVRPYRWRAILGASLAFVLTGMSFIRPYLSKPLVDDALGGGNFPLLVQLVGIMMAVLVIGAVGRALQRRLMAKTGSRVARDIRGRIYSHLQKLSLGFFSRKQTGSLVAIGSSRRLGAGIELNLANPWPLSFMSNEAQPAGGLSNLRSFQDSNILVHSFSRTAQAPAAQPTALTNPNSNLAVVRPAASALCALALAWSANWASVWPCVRHRERGAASANQPKRRKDAKAR